MLDNLLSYTCFIRLPTLTDHQVSRCNFIVVYVDVIYFYQISKSVIPRSTYLHAACTVYMFPGFFSLTLLVIIAYDDWVCWLDSWKQWLDTTHLFWRLCFFFLLEHRKARCYVISCFSVDVAYRLTLNVPRELVWIKMLCLGIYY